MSWLSDRWRRSRKKRQIRALQRAIDPQHDLRRHLAYYVEFNGFEIGDYSYGSPEIDLMWSSERLIVGRYCSIGPGVRFILGGNHHLNHATTFPLKRVTQAEVVEEGPFSRGAITVGNDVWIGSYATILSGVSIGHGAVIGSSAVVAGDVDPYAIVVGNPARLVRKRFSDQQIAALLDVRWWDMGSEQIRQMQPLLQSQDIDRCLTELARLRAEPRP